MINFSGMMGMGFKLARNLAPGFIRDCLYVQPAGVTAQGGVVRTTEASAAVSAVVVAVQPRDLDLVITQPGDVWVFVNSDDLGSILPDVGDYLTETTTGRRWVVRFIYDQQAASAWRLVATEGFDEDWGDLTAVTVSDDWGDFAAASALEDWGGVPS